MVDLKAAPFHLTEEQVKWVETTIDNMTDEEKIGQLFVHMTGSRTEEEVKEDVDGIHMGGIRFNPGTREEMWTMNYNFQKYSKIPVLSAVNVECGGTGATKDGTFVGSEMKVAATGDSKYAYELGRICGIETRATGSNWAFSPIVDLVRNWHNPGIVTRGFSDDPDWVLECSKQYFKGISESGIVCAMKHFPGDGSDERDPHIAGSVNSLSCEEWDATYGKIYRGMIEAGVQALMPGHIMMPAYSRHFRPEIKDEQIMPATLAPEILNDLLRGKLGFNGLIVTDASHMVGVAGRAKRSDLVPGAIISGCDMFLFFNDVDEDFGFMIDAYKDGRLTKERLRDALRRILGLKAVCGLDTFTMDKFPKKEGLSVIGCEQHRKITAEISDKAITLAKHTEDIFPLTPEKYKKIMIVPVGPQPDMTLVISGQALDGSKLVGDVEAALKEKGFETEIYVDPVKAAAQAMAGLSMDEIQKLSRQTKGKGIYGMKQSIAALKEKCDLVVCVANVSATMKTVQRLEWAISKGGWDNPWYVNDVPTIFVSFNGPFHLADVPQVKNYINCYDSHETTVKSLIEKMCGNSEFQGKSPVDVFCGMFDTRI